MSTAVPLRRAVWSPTYRRPPLPTPRGEPRFGVDRGSLASVETLPEGVPAGAMLGATYPAWMASRKDAVEALSYD